MLRLLASPLERRAEVIRQLHEAPESRHMAELLMDLEQDGMIRANVMEAAPRGPVVRKALAQKVGTTTRYLLINTHADVVALANKSTGTVVGTVAYDPWGVPRATSAPNHASGGNQTHHTVPPAVSGFRT